MPLYEYQCQSCGHRFERIQKFSDAPVAECPKCVGPVLKLLSSPAFHLKGTGWYATDYARQGDKSSSAESKSDAKSDAKSDSADAKTSTESKPAKESTSSETKETKPSESAPKPKT